MPPSAYKLSRHLVASIAFLCFGNNIHSQSSTVKLERLGTENGLPSNTIYSIVQDKRGYLWLGTNDGLSRYDGYEFKNYRYNPLDSNSIPGKEVFFIHQDKAGNLWIGAGLNLCIYNPEKDNFSTIRSPYVGFHQLIELVDEDMMLRTHNGIYLFNPVTRKLREIFKKSGTRVTYMFTDNNGVYYAAVSHDNADFLYRYESGSNNFTRITNLTSVHNDRRDDITSLFVDHRNTWWVGTTINGGIYRWHWHNDRLGSPKSELIKRGLRDVKKIFQDKTGKIWFTCANGVFSYDYFSGKLITITEQPANTIFQDHTGVLWIGGYNGLFKTNTVSQKFSHFSSQITVGPKLLNNFVLGIRELPDKKIFVRYYWGERRFSILDSSLESIAHYDKKRLSFYDYLRMASLKNPDLAHSDTLKKLLHAIYYLDQDPGENSCLIADRQKQLWLSSGSLFLLDSVKSHRKQFDANISDIRLCEDELWITSHVFGLWSIHTSTHQVKKYQVTDTSLNEIGSNSLNCLLIEKNGNIWIGTKGTGLDYFDRTRNRFFHYTTVNGLPNNSVFSLVMDDRGRLWIGTGNGLSCFDTTSKKFKNFHRSDGLLNSEFNRYSACKLSNGYLMMGGMNGIDYFHPDSVLHSVTKPLVQITDFRVYDKSILPAANISLAHADNYVTIDFVIMDFRNPALNQFAYMLKGVDKDWIHAGHKRSISYANLAPGRYHFLVKGAGSDGIWNEIPAEIYFSISTPWWRTGWFYTTAAIALFVVFYSIYRFRINQLKKLFALRSKISQDLHDEVGATLTSISFLSEVAKQQNKSNSETLDKIGEFSRDMIGEMNDIVWAINPENDKFGKIEDRMHNFASTLLASKNIEINFQADPELKSVNLGMQQRKNLYLIFKEAVNNAAKYSNCTRIDILISRSDGHIRMQIKDNGRGFTPGENVNGSGGNGLRNMYDRATEVHAKFELNSYPGKGTSIDLQMPITQNAY